MQTSRKGGARKAPTKTKRKPKKPSLADIAKKSGVYVDMPRSKSARKKKK